MGWHSTVESALGLTHPCEVRQVLINPIVGYRWQVKCENCGPIGWRGEGGFRSPAIAEHFAAQHEARHDQRPPMTKETNMTATTKGLRLSISRPGGVGDDYTLDGVSAGADHLVLIGWTGHDIATCEDYREILPLPRDSRAFSPGPGAPAVALEIRKIGEPVPSIVPVAYDEQRNRWSRVPGAAAGGNYAHGDSRLSELLRSRIGHGFYGAVAIHGRIESR